MLPSWPPAQPMGSTSRAFLLWIKRWPCCTHSCPELHKAHQPSSQTPGAPITAAMTCGCTSWAWDEQHETFPTFLDCVANRELALECGGFPKLVCRRRVEWRIQDCWILFWRKVLQGKCQRFMRALCCRLFILLQVYGNLRGRGRGCGSVAKQSALGIYLDFCLVLYPTFNS